MFQDYIPKIPGGIRTPGTIQREPVLAFQKRGIASSPIPYKSAKISPEVNPNMTRNELCDEIYRADMLEGGHERVWWTQYDSMPFDRAIPNTREQNFFTVPLGAMTGAIQKTKIWTNQKQARTLPDPQFFRVHFVGFYLLPFETADPATTSEDLMLAVNNSILTWIINDKTYYQTLGWDMPAGGGQRVQAYPGDLSTEAYVFNGMPDQRTMKLLRVPVTIKKNQSFYWTVEVDPGAWEVITATAKWYAYITMHGEMFRSIQ